MKKMLKKRSGFTLVELLIVIIIIGILAGAMLMLVGSGTDRAEATKIVSDLRSLKAAALMWYADNPDKNPTGVSDLTPYMDKPLSDYTFTAASFDVAPTNRWWVGRTGLTANSGVATALDTNASSVGLWGTSGSAPATSADTPYVKDDTAVWMRAR